MKNKKILIAISAIGVAAGFWACGSGAVEPPNESDGTARSIMDSHLVEDPFGFSAQISKSKELCSADVDCLNEMAKANGKALEMSSSEEPVSSQAVPQSSSAIASSSSRWEFSSMGPVGPQSSSSTVPPVQSSSSSVVAPPVTGLGACAPAKTSAELGESVEWKFIVGAALQGKVSELMGLKYEWTFPAGTPGTSSEKSPKVSYSQSGTKSATLKVTASSGTEEITCSPLRVNGQPITGCKCVATIDAPDVASGEAATWNVMGCTSKANITKYTWTKATADASGLEATAAVAAKGDIVSGVSVTVENDDSTAVTVTCPDAKAIDSRVPDYEFKASGNTNAITFTGDVDATVVFNLPSGWHGSDATCNFACQVTRGQGGNGAISGTLGTTKLSGNDYVKIQIPVSNTVGGKSLPFKVTVSPNEAIVCSVEW